MNDLILTGIPRSGTTLSCYLLNELPNVVALHEPVSDWGEEHDARSACNRVEVFLQETRRSLLEDGIAPSKQSDGKVPANPMGSYSLSSKIRKTLLGGPPVLRKSIVERGYMRVEKPLSEDFLLCVKHNGQFTALLNELQERGYPCAAVIRHPLAVLASWNSINFAPYHGRMHAAESLDPALSRSLDAIDDRFSRQIHLLDWFYTSFFQNLAAQHIIPYEKIIASNGNALQRIVPAAAMLNKPLKSKNSNKLYDRNVIRALAGRLEQADGAFWQFYEREKLSIVRDEMLA